MTPKYPLCKLCLKEPATQKNSHIVPRHMGISMLRAHDGKRQGYVVNDKTMRGGKARYLQDTPKEDHIMCPRCDGVLLSNLETQFAKSFFYRVKTEAYRREHPDFLLPKGYHYRRIEGVEYQLFKLTWYSIFWRASVSSLPLFANLCPDADHIEQLRAVVSGDSDFLDLPLAVFTAERDLDPTNNLIYANSSSGSKSVLWANEYLAYLNHEPESEHSFSDIALTDSADMKLGVLQYSEWHGLRNKMLTTAAAANVSTP